MNIRPKTVRRLLVLFSGFALLCGITALLLVHAYHRQEAEIQASRTAGFKAYAEKDYPAAVTFFHDYLTRSHADHTDAEALFAYARSRMETPEDGNRQITEAIELMQRYLNIAPSDPDDAGHQLLTLYLAARYNAEARMLCDKLLAKNPHDLQALRGRVEALLNDRNYTDALAACHNLNQVDPTDLLWQQGELRLMAQVQKPPALILAHAKSLLAAHRDDPRFQALMAVAMQLTGDSIAASKKLEAAAKLPPADADSALEMIGLLNEIQRFDLSDDLLARAQAKTGDLRLQRLSIQREFERSQYAQVLEHLKPLGPSGQSQPMMLGYKAMALYELNRGAQAQAVVGKLAAHKDDASLAWAEALSARYAQTPAEPAAQIKTYHDAIARDPRNPVFHLFLGQARQSLDESDEALHEWTEAAKLSPAWATPFYRISRLLSSLGRYPAALRAAELLGRRAPRSAAAQIAYFIAKWGVMSANPALIGSDEGQRFLKDLEGFRAALPQDTQTLATYVAALGLRGQRDKAIAVVKAALTSKTPLPEGVLGELSKVNDQQNLDLGPLILDRAQQMHGMTPAVAYARAYALHQAGKQAESLQLVASLRQSHPNDPVWRLAEARFLDVIGDSGALHAWIALCDANPHDVRIQYQALNSPARFSDRAFWRKTIDRVRALTGEDAQVWPLEQARWELAGKPTAGELDTVIVSLQKVVASAPELADAHRLLAQALLRTNRPENLSKAAAELGAAHDLQPDDFRTAELFAPVLAAQGMNDKARQVVDGVCGSAALPMNRRLWAARMYDQLASPDAAIALLTAPAAGPLDSESDALLAHLDLRAGRTADASALYLGILNDPRCGAEPLVAGAEFFAGRRQIEQADRFIDRLSKLKLAAGSIELLKAHVLDVEGNHTQAIAMLGQAVASHPRVAQLWQELTGLYLRGGDLADADKTAAAGLAAIGQSPVLTALRGDIASLKSLTPRDLGPLIQAVSRDPLQPACQQTLKALADASARHADSRQVLLSLRQLSDQFTSFLPLQELVVTRYVLAKQFKEAIDVASRSAAVAPNSPEPSRLLYAAQAAAGNWDAARAAAARWRQASLAEPLQADVAVALTYLQQSPPNPAAALKQLDGYMTDAAPQALQEAATPVYCRALLMAGRPDDAAARLKPLLLKGPRWVDVWLELATVAQPNADAAGAWLKRCEELAHFQTPARKIKLASAWEQVGSRFDSVGAHETARDLLAPIVSHPPVPAVAWANWALVNQSLGNLPEAERAWRACLALSPDNAGAENNEAFVLLLEGGGDRLAEAEKLSKQAIAAAPDASTFYDTLGRIQNQTGQRAAAIVSFRAAMRKDPNDVEAMIGLADMLQSQPASREEARLLLARITVIIDGGAPLAPSIRKQLDRVKTALSSSL